MGLTPVYSVAALREVEQLAQPAPLMGRAGAAAAGVARTLLACESAQVLVLAGPGNNGGDAFIVARHLREAGHLVRLIFVGDATRLSADARDAHAAWLGTGASIVSKWPDNIDLDLIVDGLFGIGLTRAPAEPYTELIQRSNASGAPILALDIASGLNADTGVAFETAIHATHTTTFIALKPGLLTGAGVELSGTVSVHALGLAPKALAAPSGYQLDWSTLRTRLPPRRRDAHKGTHGTLAILGGAQGMTGALLLAGRAALHTGAGKVLLGFVGENSPAVDFAQPELMLRPAEDIDLSSPNALAVGPGLGRNDAARDALIRALTIDLPLVLDADALNQIADDDALARMIAARSAPTLLTPHPAEAARLLRSTIGEVQNDRISAALALATRFQVGLVLKGAGSICAFNDGRWFINSSGNAGLASAGTGDVLTGFIGSLFAQGLNAEEALLVGVCLHGAAADHLVANGVGPIGLAASELAPAARALINTAPETQRRNASYTP